MKRGPDAATLLTRTLRQQALAAGVAIAVGDGTAERWQSATFSGMRHTLAVSAPDTDACAQWLGTLAEAEFDLPGHLVADMVVRRVDRANGRVTARLEALTIED